MNTRHHHRPRFRILLVLCPCKRRYLNTPFSDHDYTKRGYCDLCEEDHKRAIAQSESLAHTEAFSAWLDVTGDSILMHPAQPAADEESRIIGLPVEEEPLEALR
jgi:hypothetical protein